ncbi:MAG: hypothetical protein K940chlam2_01295 [Chlamydiae bacterium]|nr:hypothetical protein [Chlamydiota bacterium]
MEAAQQLAIRKHRAATGQIESLMYRVPPPFRFFFPQFFALIGTNDAIALLRHLMEDRFSVVRVEALLSAARFGRDDLLPSIRSSLTHLDVAEQEAAAFSVGLLKDTRCQKRLIKLLDSPQSNVQIAAALSLHKLGDHSGIALLLEKAGKEDLYAIQALSAVNEGADLLARLSKHADIQVRLNATMALLAMRDDRAALPLMELLLHDSRDMGFMPHPSLGRSQLSWKAVFSAAQHQKEGPYDIFSSTIMLREQLLTQALELSDEIFMKIAETLLHSRQADLIPLLTNLLENLQTPEAITLLKQSASRAGDPLARAYCSLALFRLKEEGPWEENVKGWARRNLSTEMIQFRPMVTIDQRITRSPFELTPEDHSRLLIETFQTIADRHEESGIALLLDALEKGNPKNRYVLAGLLLRALQ